MNCAFQLTTKRMTGEVLKGEDNWWAVLFSSPSNSMRCDKQADRQIIQMTQRGRKSGASLFPQKKCQLGMWLQRRRSVVSVFVVVVIIIINGRRCCVTRLDGRTDGRANGNAIGAPPHSFVDLDLQLMITSYHNKTPPNRLYCTSVAVKGNCNCIFVLNCALPLLWCACV